MSDITLVVDDADATGHHDGRALSVAVRGNGGDLRAGLYGWTWGGCGYIERAHVRIPAWPR